ncbi:MAG: high light inducible protein [Microcystis aeruginosa G11-06]|nr:high light inducible protein [Microcystis aeruginosa G11-06]
MDKQENKLGFTAFAENWIAMLGFVIGVATEYLTHKGILAQLGLM